MQTPYGVGLTTPVFSCPRSGNRRGNGTATRGPATPATLRQSPGGPRAHAPRPRPPDRAGNGAERLRTAAT
eukprot:4743233-Lingulodinium_polyedra.AAC.1